MRPVDHEGNVIGGHHRSNSSRLQPVAEPRRVSTARPSALAKSSPRMTHPTTGTSPMSKNTSSATAAAGSEGIGPNRMHSQRPSANAMQDKPKSVPKAASPQTKATPQANTKEVHMSTVAARAS